ncbi:RodZ domain-containing protein [Sphingomonas sp.]|uniref:helix-turn-helix domain-containing protein n=1 Tax=Sphingomonas sp. TaxID=28214 RepID=UPI003B3A497D
MTTPTVGARLRAAREARALAIEDVAARTRIPTRHLQMIERGDYAGLPAPTYSAGFIKTYARLLGLDGQSMSDQFRGEIGSSMRETQRPQPYEPADPRRTPPIGLALLALLVAVLVSVGYLYWRGASESATEIAAAASDAPTTASPQPAATPTQTTAPVPAASPDGPVTVGASQEVWVRVSDGGKTLFMGILKPGERFEVPADAVSPLLTTGRPGATLLTLGTTQIAIGGDPDRAAKDISLTAPALRERAAGQANGATPTAGSAIPG